MPQSSLQNFRPLLLALLCTLMLILSWLWPPTHALWTTLDILVFRCLNNSLLLHPYIAYFWAFCNADLCDWVMESLVLGLTVLALRKRASRESGQTYIDFIIYYLLLTIAGLVFKRILHHYLGLYRLSPTLVLENTVRLKWMLNLKIKDASRSSFPADHALFILLWLQYALRRFDQPYKRLSLAVGIFFCLPRLFSGGHWLTDIIFGALLPSWVFAKAALACSGLFKSQ